MNIVIVGPGAVGSLWAHYLSQAGHRVSFWSRDPAPLLHRRIDEANIISLANNQLSELTRADLLLVTTKAWQVLDALLPLQGQLNCDTVITLMHNGMGTATPVAAAFPDNPIVLATTTHGALTEQKLDTEVLPIAHTGHGITQLGGFNEAGKRCDFLAEVFDHALAPANWHENVTAALWHKLAVNCAINPLTALHQVRNGELAQARFQATLTELYREISAVMNAEHIVTSASDIQRAVETVYQATAANYSSMHQDRYFQRRSEIDFITGYLIDCAAKHGIDVPNNLALYQSMTELDATLVPCRDPRSSL
ncbi:2-dehydropantoate 2-reductase [Vibrio sp. SM6]|uniref:2-dehydropantoate 2-reductase n=1 Tax=Vibrio agarilyticus TaxID=2726741 RepID=A0A7X8TQS2_9VIBR|nr:2-dehydropantoate 2-reductase [Vibrio agarilyticus]NLS13116.1 2-dehydropantoate 2-reductase [Vibrio agarilyticus]